MTVTLPRPRRAAGTTLVAAAVMVATLLVGAPMAQAAVAGTANPGVGETLRVRSAPNTTATIVANIAHGAALSIVCKTTGTAVNGTTQWDKLSNGYVSHAFVTVAGGTTIPTCGTTTPPATPTATVDVAAGNTLTVRSTASTSGTAVGSLADGAKVTVSCKTTGTSVSGTFGTTTTWYKISNGYISAAYASLSGTVSACTTTTPPPPTTVPAARQRIIDRAKYWYDASNGRISGIAAFGRNINGSAKEGPTGTARYRTDCSGLIAMAWELGSGNQPSSGQYISSQASLVKAVNVTDLKAGDILAADGHVTMFHQWSNKAAWQYYAYDFGGGTGGAGPMEYKVYTLNSVSGDEAKRNNDSRQYYARRLVRLTD